MDEIYQLLADNVNFEKILLLFCGIVTVVPFIALLINESFKHIGNNIKYDKILTNTCIGFLILGISSTFYLGYLYKKIYSNASVFLKSELILVSEYNLDLHSSSNVVIIEFYKDISEKIPNCVALDDSQANSCFKNIRITESSLRIVTNDKIGSSAWKKKIHENRDALIKAKKQQASNYPLEKTVAL